MLPFFFVFVALGSFSRLFGTDWKERTSRDFVRVKLMITFFSLCAAFVNDVFGSPRN